MKFCLKYIDLVKIFLYFNDSIQFLKIQGSVMKKYNIKEFKINLFLSRLLYDWLLFPMNPKTIDLYTIKDGHLHSNGVTCLERKGERILYHEKISLAIISLTKVSGKLRVLFCFNLQTQTKTLQYKCIKFDQVVPRHLGRKRNFFQGQIDLGPMI